MCLSWLWLDGHLSHHQETLAGKSLRFVGRQQLVEEVLEALAPPGEATFVPRSVLWWLPHFQQGQAAGEYSVATHVGGS